MISFYDEYKDFSKKEINEAFVSACAKADLDRVKYLINSSELLFNAKPSYENNKALMIAFNNNAVDVIKYITNPAEVKKAIDIKSYSSLFLELACKQKDYDWVDQLLPIAKESSNHSAWRLVHHCCEEGNVDMVKYLLNSPTWSNQIHVDAGIFTSACRGDNVELIEYLLNSKWKDIFDIHEDNDLPFINCCLSQSLETANYFIFNLNIPKTRAISEYLLEDDNEFNKNIEKIFDARHLTQSLDAELHIKDNKPMKKNKL
jgi:ankyrin repeat protein